MRKRWNVLLIAGAVMALAVGCGAKEETKAYRRQALYQKQPGRKERQHIQKKRKSS